MINIKKVFLEELPHKYGIGANKNKLVVDWKKSIGYKVAFRYDDIEGDLEIIDYNIGFITIQYHKSILNICTGDFSKCKIGTILSISLNSNEYLDFIIQWKQNSLNKKETNKVFFEILPKCQGKIDWINSKDYRVYFIYKDIEGWFKIINYIKDKQRLIIEYNQKQFDILTGHFIDGQLGVLLGKITSDFKYNIGQNFKDSKRDLVIIDRKIRNEYNDDGSFKQNRKWYKYKCNKCDYDEGWMSEGNLNIGNGCGTCCTTPRTIVLGINTIWDTDKWMIPIVGEEFAKTHTHSCMDKIYPVCLDCGRIKSTKICINNLYNRHSIGCSCSDNIPYGEKIMFNVLERLELDFQTQLSKTTFKWCENYKYDFYFKLNGEDYICEVNGMQHYQDAWDKLDKTQLNDRLKKYIALKNGIKEENYIVIDCRKSEIEWIRDHILESNLHKIFDLSIIDWLKCSEFACSNLVKVACEYKRNNPYLTSVDIGKVMGFNYNTIIRWLKRGSKELNWCEYNPKEEQKKGGKMSAPSKFKPIKCLNNNMTFNSIKECAENSEKIFGIKLLISCISAVCRGKQKSTQGYKFQFI